jgi:pimeloyl-ACP methyl ester carboxylesterase
MAPVARGLADSFRVLEPFQRGSGDEALTVARHVADLHELIESRCEGTPPALVGHSWGAMLALACAAAHPDRVRSLVLIGCGTFDPAARERMRAVCQERMDPGARDRMERLEHEFPDPDERLAAMGKLIQRVHSCELIADEDEAGTCDAPAHEETWADMLKQQERGVYPAAFAAIRSPVVMMHGALDPHPGRMIYAGLKPCLPQLEYREWERCGHYPWLENAARDEFHSFLRAWLTRHSS